MVLGRGLVARGKAVVDDGQHKDARETGFGQRAAVTKSERA